MSPKLVHKIKKYRIDKLLLDNDLVKSRSEALGLLMSGKVFVNKKKIEKPGLQFPANVEIFLKQSKIWVSRGGFKLSKAIREFNLNCDSIIALDIGSSTGGFTDVLLQNNAKKIYCVDVGYGQLDWKIRNNEKVVVFEKTNARYLDNNIIKDDLDAIVCDTSFISLKKVLPASLNFLKKNGWVVALIKPQFEIGKGLVGKNGIVKNEIHHNQVKNDIKNWFSNNLNFKVNGLIESPILGPKGNKEFLILAVK